VLRAESNPNNASQIAIHAKFWGDARTNFHVYGIVAGQRVIEASVSASAIPAGGYSNGYEYTLNGTATFFPLSPLYVDGFEIVLNAGMGTSSYIPGDVYLNGSISASNSSPNSHGVTVGNYYWVRNTGSPWTGRLGNPAQTNAYVVLTNSTFPDVLESIVYQYTDYSTSPSREEYVIQATNPTVYVRVSDDQAGFGDNAGTLNYEFRNATLEGRKIELSSSTITRICPPNEI
jgi:hypothetical protein